MHAVKNIHCPDFADNIPGCDQGQTRFNIVSTEVWFIVFEDPVMCAGNSIVAALIRPFKWFCPHEGKSRLDAIDIVVNQRHVPGWRDIYKAKKNTQVSRRAVQLGSTPHEHQYKPPTIHRMRNETTYDQKCLAFVKSSS